MSAERAGGDSGNVSPVHGLRPAERFVVTEVEGIEIGGKRNQPMLSVQVLDSAYCYGIVAEIREESLSRARWSSAAERRDALRRRARGLAATLNAKETGRLTAESRAALKAAISATKRERLIRAGAIYTGPTPNGFREHGANGYRKGCKCDVCREGEAARKRAVRRADPEKHRAECRAYRQRKRRTTT